MPHPNQAGELNHHWKGGITVHSKGYPMVYDPAHPRAQNGYVFQHIVIAEDMLGRPLQDNEEVHHVNGKKWDNRPSNLQVHRTGSAHIKAHHTRGDYPRDARGRWLKRQPIWQEEQNGKASPDV